MRRIGQIVMMGGAYWTQHREANVTIDPEAADTVFRSGIPITAIGFEEARRTTVPLSTYEEAPFAGSPLGALYRAMAAGYSRAYGTESAVLYDVTAACVAVRPHWFTFEEVRVGVELHGRLSRGMTVVERDPVFNAVPDAVPLRIVNDHDADAVLRLFSETVLQGAWPLPG